MKYISLLIFTLLAVLVLITPVHSQDVLIYSDDGTWEEGIIALEHFFDNQNVTHKRIYAVDLNTDIWNKQADAILFPGGYSYNYQLAISLAAVDSIRNYVAKGGGYIGICAGAYFASKTVAWEGESYPYELGLFDGTATGSLNYVAPWPSYVMTDVKLNKNNSITQNKPNKISVLYYGGPIFTPNSGVEIDTIATWNSADNTPAIINFEYEKGRVLLLGPHLEVEESDDRDGTAFAAELDDIESDWDVLENGYKWLTNSVVTSVIENEVDLGIKLFPNPVNENLTIENNSDNIFNSYIIFNSEGKQVLSNLEFENIINISALNRGVYSLELKNFDGKTIRKEFVVK